MIFVPRDKPLYHYTDLEGLKGIADKHDLWLTHSRYCNDYEEMTHGYDVARDVIGAQRALNPSAEWSPYLDAVTKLLAEPPVDGSYICCFCLEDNLLSQWRSYGANGAGVSIKLEPKDFDYVCGPDSPFGGLMRLWKVFYKSDQQESIVGNALNFAFADATLPMAERPRRAAEAIEFFIPTFKKGDFKEEAECRLIFTPSPTAKANRKFRVGRGMLVPYYSLRALSAGLPNDPGRLPITGVCVGPSAHRTLNVVSAQMLLEQAGYSGVKAEASTTSYRA
jgi:hypothetical protein